MSLPSRLHNLFRHTFGRARAERDLHEEIASYLELLITEKQSAGLSPAEARRAALLELRGTDQVKEAVRDGRPGVMFDTVIRDVRHAVRGLRRQPGLTLTALVTLGLAIGGATGVFSIVDAVLLRPLAGVRDPARLVTFSRIQPSGSYDNFSLPDFDDYAAGAPAFQSLAAHVDSRINADPGGGGPAVRLRADLVTDSYFSTLGVTPLLGRLLDARDGGAPGEGRVAVLSEALWRSAFGGAADIVGGTIRVNGSPFRIVGVAGGRFAGTATGAPMDLWLPLAARPVAMPQLSTGIERDRAAGWIQIFGRLRSGSTLAEAGAQLAVVSARLAGAYPLTDADRHVEVAKGLGLYPDDRVELAGTMRLLLGAVTLVLLIACANVAGLLLVRFDARRREMAARLALGGGVRRLVMQTLVEGLALTLPATALGLVVAISLASVATATQPSSSVFHQLPVTLDLPVLGFALGSAILSGLLVAALPALRAAGLSPMSVLQEGGRGAAPRRSRLQRVLVAGQVALSFVILVASAALLVGLYQVVNAPPGFETRDAAMVSVDLGMQGYAPAAGAALLDAALSRAAATPGIRSVSVGTGGIPPTDCICGVSVFHPGDVPPPDIFHGRELELGIRPAYAVVAPHFFATLGIPLLRGRDFVPADRDSAPGVAIVNEALAHRPWPGVDPIGQQLVVPPWIGAAGPPLEVVGVAADTRWRSLTEPAPPVLYVPFAQHYDGRVTLIASSSQPPAALNALRHIVSGLDPMLPTYAGATMSEHIEASLWQRRMVTLWVIVFGIVALALGTIGLYGVLSQSVVERNRELSIRMALGADARALMRLIVREGALLGAAGLAIGMPAALLSTRLIDTLDVGAVRPGMPVVSAVGAGLAIVVMFAAWIPARRAARLDPGEALRYE